MFKKFKPMVMFLASGVVMLTLSLSVLAIEKQSSGAKPMGRPAFEMDILKDFFKLTRNDQSDYPLADIFQGCPKPDCIPAIDKPEFLPMDQVDFLDDDDLIIAYIGKQQSRVYPTRMLDFHEIVNDHIDGQAIAITYCPLCGSGVAFSRELDGKVLRLGVSGVLHGSDLVLYDEKSRSLWQQITGKAFAGPRRGQSMKTLPVSMTTWARWKAAHPDSVVLKPQPPDGLKAYKKDNYGEYQSSEKVMFGGRQDPRLHPKKVVYGFATNDAAIAFAADKLAGDKVHQFKLSGSEYQISLSKEGSAAVTELATGQVYQPLRTFWFAWYTFHPETGLWPRVK